MEVFLPPSLFPLLSVSRLCCVLSVFPRAAPTLLCLPSLALVLLLLCAHLLSSLCFPLVSLCVSKPPDQFSRDITALVRGELTSPTALNPPFKPNFTFPSSRFYLFIYLIYHVMSLQDFKAAARWCATDCT